MGIFVEQGYVFNMISLVMKDSTPETFGVKGKVGESISLTPSTLSFFDKKVSAAGRLENELSSEFLKAEKSKPSILASAFSGGMCE